MRCNATFTTLAHTDDVVSTRYHDPGWQPPVTELPDGVTVTRAGDRLLRDDVTVVSCQEVEAGHGGSHWNDDAFVEWSDDTLGATPHREPDETTTWPADVRAATAALRDAYADGEWSYGDTDWAARTLVGTAAGRALLGRLREERDPMDELVAVSEEAGLYEDPCPDCEHFPKLPCPSCGGSVTAPTVTDADGWVWCEHQDFPVGADDEGLWHYSNRCPGPHRTLIIGPTEETTNE